MLPKINMTGEVKTRKPDNQHIKKIKSSSKARIKLLESNAGINSSNIRIQLLKIKFEKEIEEMRRKLTHKDKVIKQKDKENKKKIKKLKKIWKEWNDREKEINKQKKLFKKINAKENKESNKKNLKLKNPYTQSNKQSAFE